jgi:hypothetical protein
MSWYQSLFNESTVNANNYTFPTGAVAGYFLVCGDSNGSFLWAPISAYSVTSITGTANQVIASSATGDITLSLPQSIATSSSPTFVLVTANVAGNLTGLVLTAAQPNITSVGSLTGLTMAGNLDMGNQDIVNCDVINAGNYNGGVTGNVLGDLQGSVLQASQPLITSLGTLTGLSITNLLSMIGSSSTVGGEIRLVNSALNGFTIFNQGTTMDFQIGKMTGGVWQYNVITIDYTSGAITIGKNINSGSNTITAATFIGNVTGNITGTVLTAAQPNITSLGTLISLTMGGAIDMGNFNINNADTITSTSFLGALTGSILQANQPFITTMAGLVSINGQSIVGTDLAKIVGITNGNCAASKALVVDSSRNITNINSLTSTGITIGSGNLNMASNDITNCDSLDLVTLNMTGNINCNTHNITNINTFNATDGTIATITSGTIINANGILLTNQSGTVASPNISLYLLAGGLYYHKTNQLIGLSDGSSRIIECDKKNNIVNQDIETNFNSAVNIVGGDLDMGGNSVHSATSVTTDDLVCDFATVGTSVEWPNGGIQDHYEQGSFTMNFSGPYTFSDTVYYCRSGKLVNLTFSSQVSNRVTTANYIQSTASDCPSSLRPNVTQFGFIYGADNNAGKQLSYAFETSGKILIGNSSTDVTAAFTAGSPIISGYYGFTITHSVS